MNLGIAGQAAGLFAVTNVDDLVVLALFFARGAGRRGAGRRVVAGQYLGFAAILAVAVAAAFGATFLPGPVLPYLGLLPLALGLKAAWAAWRDRPAARAARDGAGPSDGPGEAARDGGPRTLEVAAVTFANGGDNVGVYVPVFATAGLGATTVYASVFLVLVGVWCLAGAFLATRPVVARALSRWGHVVFPVVLIAIGLLILVEGLTG
ncbi:cadmium resistance transporter [Nonomuraea pusilla]|uniref:Cadmium resistance protein CadD, predicted permease n=1 Tax=Nonomuraea pusilla TaxID=46177 RepID=A0A1H8B557_9ACTN|nr:cadmium resistance transporter [Nonomuraea pusilla]SEM78075.1 Cadmium resistance protein CadD, predicted permease [Nonomuraea pusilla]